MIDRPTETAGELSPAELHEAWRKTAWSLHPDRGGDVAAFQEAKAAYLAAVERAYALNCAACRGKGRVRRFSGFDALDVNCSICLGTGKRFPRPKGL